MDERGNQKSEFRILSQRSEKYVVGDQPTASSYNRAFLEHRHNGH